MGSFSQRCVQDARQTQLVPRFHRQCVERLRECTYMLRVDRFHQVTLHPQARILHKVSRRRAREDVLSSFEEHVRFVGARRLLVARVAELMNSVTVDGKPALIVASALRAV